MPSPQSTETGALRLHEPAAPDQRDALTRIADALESMIGTHTDTTVHSPSEAQPLLDASPIACLLHDETVTDVLINGPTEIYIGRGGVLEKTDVTFPDVRSLTRLAEAVARSVGRQIDPLRPLVDARLADGSRVNIIAPPMAVRGLCMSIRKFPQDEITLDKLIASGSINDQIATFLKLAAEARVSMLISGGTGTGKTTMLNAISHYIPVNERIVTIEDTAELRLQQPHVIRLETKEPSVIGERREEVNTSDLLRNALRMRPDRIIVGEVRGEEAYDMIQAMNTGHDGSMATVHANTPRDALARMENLMGPRTGNTPAISLRRQIVSALSLIIQLARSPEGRYYVSQIAEVVGLEGDIPSMQDIFSVQENLTPDNKVEIEQVWNSIFPRHVRLAEMLRQENVFPLPEL